MRSTNSTYQPNIMGGSLATINSNNSSQHKSQPCIPGEYVWLVFLVAGAAGILGVAMVSTSSSVTYCRFSPIIAR